MANSGTLSTDSNRKNHPRPTDQPGKVYPGNCSGANDACQTVITKMTCNCRPNEYFNAKI
ncbi:hypothetical protein NECAME_06091 [Necator americanus]|uniref:Uncharacterized protein n=1 Tax=Necator americanus TaxID=51031 RepID=W2TW80_NECAM|nr:hypothetical protein NECAME_06091 [Necator americanus]ETN86118.1 hypothetical protein NECAME_06091 [Necator americanus]